MSRASIDAHLNNVRKFCFFSPFRLLQSKSSAYHLLSKSIEYIHYVDSIGSSVPPPSLPFSPSNLPSPSLITVNEYLIHHCSLSPTSLTSPVGLVVSSSFSYCSPLSYPSPVIAALAVEKLGKSSVTYSVALFAAKGGGGSFKGKAGGTVKAELEVDGKGEAAAFGSFVHVFVDPVGRGSVGIPEEARAALERILVPR